LNGINHLLAYADDVTEALLDASKEVGVEVNPEKTKFTLMSRYQWGSWDNLVSIMS
jgi:hypothetical protein